MNWKRIGIVGTAGFALGAGGLFGGASFVAWLGSLSSLVQNTLAAGGVVMGASVLFLAHKRGE